jgi:hypothetical protein
VTHCLALNAKELKAGLKLSSKEFIVAEIITRFKISKGVAGRRRHRLEELDVILPSLESYAWSQTSIASPEFKLRIAGFLRKHRTALVVISTAPLQQLERVLPEPATGLPEPHPKTVADGHKLDRAVLSLA